MKNIEAAIFDMDGTLIDSMWVWDRIDVDYLKKRNKEMLCDFHTFKNDIEHLTFEECAQYFKDNYGIEDSTEDIMAEWNSMAFDEYAHNIKLKPGAREYLKSLKEKGVKIGLATSNSDDLIEAVLENNGIYDFFDSITTTAEVSRGKNFPDVYLLAAEKLKTNPENCVVFEDILPAVIGAKAAGMKVIGVHDIYSGIHMKEMQDIVDRYIFKFDELMEAI